MGYIGIGFALARLPKFLWRRALPDQSKLPEHPALNWMILDGYAFHESFSIAAASTFWIGIVAAIAAAGFLLFLRETPMRSTFEMEAAEAGSGSGSGASNPEPTGAPGG